MCIAAKEEIAGMTSARMCISGAHPYSMSCTICMHAHPTHDAKLEENKHENLRGGRAEPDGGNVRQV